MSSIGNKLTALLPSLELIAEVAANIAAILPPTASLVGAIQLGIKVANGVVNEVPLIVQTYDDLKAAVAGGQPISDEQWVEWQAMVDQAHTDFVAAAGEVIAKG